VIFFTTEQVIKVHSSLISQTGWLDGLRDKNLLDSALKSPFQTFDGKELYSQEELIDLGFGIASGKYQKADITFWILNHRK